MNIIIESESFVADSMRNALGGDIPTVPGVPEFEKKLASATVDTVIIGPGIDEILALRQAELLRTSQPTLGVILVRQRVDAAVLGAALRAGIREVLGYRDLSGLAESVKRSDLLTKRLRDPGATVGSDKEAGRGGQIISVASPKGGTGKTTVATNLGAILADRGNRVALIDLDVMFGDVAITLGIAPEHTIEEASALLGNMDISAVRGLMTHHSSGLDVLAAPTEPSSAELISSDLVSRILALLATDFDFVVVDTPPSLDESVLAILEKSDRVVMITTLDIPAMKNVKVSLDTLRILGFPMESISLVLNRADSNVGIDVGQVPKTLNMPVMANLPSTRNVPMSTNRGVVLSVEDRKHSFSQEMSKFVGKLIAGAASPTTDDSQQATVTVKPARRGVLRLRRAV